LCASNITHDEFEAGLAGAAAYAKQLDERAVELVARERARQAAQSALEAARDEVARREQQLRDFEAIVTEFRQRLATVGLPMDAEIGVISEREISLTAEINAAREDLRILETLSLNDALARALNEGSDWLAAPTVGRSRFTMRRGGRPVKRWIAG
jgi:hypothetical protein